MPDTRNPASAGHRRGSSSSSTPPSVAERARWLAGDYLEARRFGRGLEAWLMLRGYDGELAAEIRQAVHDRECAA